MGQEERAKKDLESKPAATSGITRLNNFPQQPPLWLHGWTICQQSPLALHSWTILPAANIKIKNDYINFGSSQPWHYTAERSCQQPTPALQGRTILPRATAGVKSAWTILQAVNPGITRRTFFASSHFKIPEQLYQLLRLALHGWTTWPAANFGMTRLNDVTNRKPCKST